MEKWVEAMDDELESKKKNGVYVEVARLAAKKMTGSKWVLKIKADAIVTVEKFPRCDLSHQSRSGHKEYKDYSDLAL